jgi:hypothetical protein
MKSGRELDAEVAERVMGFRRETNGTYRHPNTPFSAYTLIPPHRERDLPAYSESVEAAVQAVEKMRERGYGWTISTHKDGWFVRCFELPDEGLEWRHSTVVKPTLTDYHNSAFQIKGTFKLKRSAMKRSTKPMKRSRFKRKLGASRSLKPKREPPGNGSIPPRSAGA